ncbi:unnamed protein product [Rotaria sp. Silwood1]|nr:unnamed protein product [Rotaria sp. Silwood1]
MIDGRPEFDSFRGRLGTGKRIVLLSVLVELNTQIFDNRRVYAELEAKLLAGETVRIHRNQAELVNYQNKWRDATWIIYKQTWISKLSQCRAKLEPTILSTCQTTGIDINTQTNLFIEHTQKLNSFIPPTSTRENAQKWYNQGYDIVNKIVSKRQELVQQINEIINNEIDLLKKESKLIQENVLRTKVYNEEQLRIAYERDIEPLTNGTISALSWLYDIYPLWDYINLGVYNCVPFVLMVIFNCGVIYHLLRLRSTTSIQNSRIQHRSISITLVITTSLFLFMTVPSTVAFAFFSSSDVGLLRFFDCLLYSHHILSFPLYMITFDEFRQEFFDMLACKTNNRRVTPQAQTGTVTQIFNIRKPVTNT